MNHSNQKSNNQTAQLIHELLDNNVEGMNDVRILGPETNELENFPLQAIENDQQQVIITPQTVPGQITNQPPSPQYYYFNYQQNQPQKQTGASGASEQKTVDVLVIGGGPASLGLLVNAVKTNRLSELIQGDGLAIIDAGLNFGGGILGRYGINSNTSGGGFLKCTYKKAKKDKEKEQHRNVDGEEAENQGNESKKKSATINGKKNNTAINGPKNGKQSKITNGAHDGAFQNPYVQQFAQSSKNMIISGPLNLKEDEILAPYRELHSSNISRVLKDFGKNTAPLSVIGHFLNYAGNHLLSFIHQTTKKKIFYPLHKAVSIQLMSNGEILTKVKRQQLEISITDDSESLKIVETDQVVVFRSRMLVISNGGVQGLHPQLFDWFPKLDPGKVVSSDEFLRSQIYLQKIKELRQKKNRKIVIIGGSHSGFSCAWMLLNGPATYYNNNAGINIEKEPHAQRKFIRNCIDCCQCGSVLANLRRNKAAQTGPNGQNSQNQQHAQQTNQITSPNKAQDKQQKGGAAPSNTELAPAACNCLCICFGLFDYDDWKFDFNQLPDYQAGDIEILYREQIKVFYNKVSDAEKDGYNQFEADKFSKKDGYLYSFSGLRGDAKDLYLKIMRNQERRVKMVQARNADEQRQYVDRADLVIWACGYQTNTIPIKDTDRKKLQLSQKVPNTQYDVDGKCRVMLADGHVLAKTFACGIAYPVRTKDGMMVNNPQINNPRADGFSLYMNYVGDTILKSLIPKAKMIKSTVHKVMPKIQMTNEVSANPSNPSDQFTKKQYQQVLKARIQLYRKNHDGPEGVGAAPILAVQGEAPQEHDRQRVNRNKSVNTAIRSSSAAPGQSDDAFSGKEGNLHGMINQNNKQRIVLHLSDDPEDEEDDYQEDPHHQNHHFQNEDEDIEEEYDQMDALPPPTENHNEKISLRIQQINSIQRQHQQQIVGAKSLDRGQQSSSFNAKHSQNPLVGGVTFQNKFSQLARSPQLLQRKQENILKLQSKGGSNSDHMPNQDLALLMTPSDKHQVLAVSRQLKSRKIRNDTKVHQQAKSPYHQQVKSQYSKIGGGLHQNEAAPGGGGSAQVIKNQGVSREILRSSQGANRKLDMILAMQNQGQKVAIPDANFKMNNNNRSSQVSFNGKQRNVKGQIPQNNETFGSHLYNSLGTGQQQTIQEMNSRSSRQGTYDQRKIAVGVELPPILHPLVQNHYVYLQEQQIGDLSSINLNQTNLADLTASHDNNLNQQLQINSDLNQSSQSRLCKQGSLPKEIIQVNDKQQRPFQQFKSQNNNSIKQQQTNSFDCNLNQKTMRSSSIYCLQSSQNNEFQNSNSQTTNLNKSGKANNNNISSTLNPLPQSKEDTGGAYSLRGNRPLSDNQREPCTIQTQGTVLPTSILLIDDEAAEDVGALASRVKKIKNSTQKDKSLKTKNNLNIKHDIANNADHIQDSSDDHDQEDLNDRVGMNSNWKRKAQKKNLKANMSPQPQIIQKLHQLTASEGEEDEEEEEDDEYGTKKLAKKAHHHRQHLESQEADYSGDDGVDEDVSSEGSCRTSLYQMSHRGVAEDYEDFTGGAVVKASKKKPTVNIGGGGHSTTHSNHTQDCPNNGTEDCKTEVSGSHASSDNTSKQLQFKGSSSDQMSSKFSFQSRIPRLSKPHQQINLHNKYDSNNNNNINQLMVSEDGQQVVAVAFKHLNKGGNSPINGTSNVGKVKKKPSMPATLEHSQSKPMRGGAVNVVGPNQVSNNHRFGGGDLSQQEKKPLHLGHHAAARATVEESGLPLFDQQNLRGRGGGSPNKMVIAHSSSSQLQRRNTLNHQQHIQSTTSATMSKQQQHSQQSQNNQAGVHSQSIHSTNLNNAVIQHNVLHQAAKQLGAVSLGKKDNNNLTRKTSNHSGNKI